MKHVEGRERYTHTGKGDSSSRKGLMGDGGNLGVPARAEEATKVTKPDKEAKELEDKYNKRLEEVRADAMNGGAGKYVLYTNPAEQLFRATHDSTHVKDAYDVASSRFLAGDSDKLIEKNQKYALLKDFIPDREQFYDLQYAIANDRELDTHTYNTRLFIVDRMAREEQTAESKLNDEAQGPDSLKPYEKFILGKKVEERLKEQTKAEKEAEIRKKDFDRGLKKVREKANKKGVEKFVTDRDIAEHISSQSLDAYYLYGAQYLRKKSAKLVKEGENYGDRPETLNVAELKSSILNGKLSNEAYHVRQALDELIKKGTEIAEAKLKDPNYGPGTLTDFEKLLIPNKIEQKQKQAKIDKKNADRERIKDWKNEQKQKRKEDSVELKRQDERHKAELKRQDERHKARLKRQDERHKARLRRETEAADHTARLGRTTLEIGQQASLVPPTGERLLLPTIRTIRKPVVSQLRKVESPLVDTGQPSTEERRSKERMSLAVNIKNPLIGLTSRVRKFMEESRVDKGKGKEIEEPYTKIKGGAGQMNDTSTDIITTSPYDSILRNGTQPLTGGESSEDPSGPSKRQRSGEETQIRTDLVEISRSLGGFLNKFKEFIRRGNKPDKGRGKENSQVVYPTILRSEYAGNGEKEHLQAIYDEIISREVSQEAYEKMEKLINVSLGSVVINKAFLDENRPKAGHEPSKTDLRNLESRVDKGEPLSEKDYGTWVFLVELAISQPETISHKVRNPGIVKLDRHESYIYNRRQQALLDLNNRIKKKEDLTNFDRIFAPGWPEDGAEDNSGAGRDGEGGPSGGLLSGEGGDLEEGETSGGGEEVTSLSEEEKRRIYGPFVNENLTEIPDYETRKRLIVDAKFGELLLGQTPQKPTGYFGFMVLDREIRDSKKKRARKEKYVLITSPMARGAWEDCVEKVKKQVVEIRIKKDAADAGRGPALNEYERYVFAEMEEAKLKQEDGEDLDVYEKLLLTKEIDEDGGESESGNRGGTSANGARSVQSWENFD